MIKYSYRNNAKWKYSRQYKKQQNLQTFLQVVQMHKFRVVLALPVRRYCTFVWTPDLLDTAQMYNL